MSGKKSQPVLNGVELRQSTASAPVSQLVSVIIPARDQANSISSLIPKIRKGLSEYSHEIIVIDDGSRDRTSEVARSNGTTVISHKKNMGKGAAMKTGGENAKGDIMVFLDADGAHDPQDILNIITPILQNKADLIIGSRALPESKVLVSPVTRRLTNNLASLVISVIISLFLPTATLFQCPMKWTRITDCTSGFRGIRKEGWDKLNLTCHGFEIETEMIYEAARNRLIIADAPISCNWNSQTSRLSILRDGLKTLKLLGGKLVGDIRGRRGTSR